MRRLVVLLTLETVSAVFLHAVGPPATTDAAGALCFWGAAALTGWLLVTSIACLACALGALRTPALRRVVERTLVFTLTVGVPATPAFAATTSTTRPPVAIEVQPDGRIVVASPSTPAPSSAPARPRAATPGAARPSPAPPRPASARVTVVAGDNLWRIAAAALAANLGRPPRDDEIAPYWRRVVEANRTTVRSGDPNLIYPGELVALPPLV